MLMSATEYRESLRRYTPRVFVNGDRVASVADEPRLAPGINAVGITYDFALEDQHKSLMLARQGTSGKTINRMLHIDETSQDLLYKLEAVRLVCRESGCALRYLSHDSLNGVFQAPQPGNVLLGLQEIGLSLVANLDGFGREEMVLAVAGDSTSLPLVR